MTNSPPNKEMILEIWTELKEKIRTMRLSEKDKQIWQYPTKSKITMFYPRLVEEDKLDQLQAEFQVIREKIASFETDQDLVLDFYFTTSTLVSLILDWIELRKTLKFYQDYYYNSTSSGPSGPTIEEVE